MTEFNKNNREQAYQQSNENKVNTGIARSMPSERTNSQKRTPKAHKPIRNQTYKPTHKTTYKPTYITTARTTSNGMESYYLYFTGMNYELGNGVQVDIARAMYYYRKAADLGLSDARDRIKTLCEMGYSALYEKIISDPQPKESKVNNDNRPAVNNNDDRQAYQFYKRGWDCEHGNDADIALAMDFYRSAAALGSEIATYRLKVLNAQKNTSLNKDINKAQTNETNNPKINKGKAYYDKAYKYENGIGVVADKNFALTMYEKALEAGYLPAQEGIRRLKSGKASEKQKETSPIPVVKIPQTNATINAANYGLQDKYIKAQNSKLLFDQAVELKRKGQYAAALTLYKSAYESYPDDPDVQSTMYAMAKVYLLIGDYEKACALFQDGLTMKLAQDDDRTARFYKQYFLNTFNGTSPESDPDYQWFQNLTADYSIFMGLSHYLLENEGAELLSQFRYDFNNHMQSVAGKPANRPSAEYLQTCYEYGWVRVILIAGEFADRGLSDIYIDHVKERKQEFLDILKTI